MMAGESHNIALLQDDIDRGRVKALTTMKNIKSVVEHSAGEFTDYEELLAALEEWHYVELLRNRD